MDSAALHHEPRMIPQTVLWAGSACGLAALWIGLGMLRSTPPRLYGAMPKPDEVSAWVLCFTGAMVALANAYDAVRRILRGRRPHKRAARKPSKPKGSPDAKPAG